MSSCFDEPLQALSTALGTSAVVLTGKTPTGTPQALVDRAVVDGDALAAGLSGDALDELPRALHAISPHLAPRGAIDDEKRIERLLRDASEQFRGANPAAAVSGQKGSAVDLDAFKRALQGLLTVLSGGSSKRYCIG